MDYLSLISIKVSAQLLRRSLNWPELRSDLKNDFMWQKRGTRALEQDKESRCRVSCEVPRAFQGLCLWHYCSDDRHMKDRYIHWSGRYIIFDTSESPGTQMYSHTYVFFRNVETINGTALYLVIRILNYP